MNLYIKKALQNIERANISGYFEEIDKVEIPSHLKPTYAELKDKFVQNLNTSYYYQQLAVFARNLEEYLRDNSQKNDNSINSDLKKETTDIIKNDENQVLSISDKVVKISPKPKQNMSSSKKKTEVQESTVPQKGFEYAFIIGVVLTFGIVIYVLVKECVSEQAFSVIRFLLPIGFAGLGAWLPGNFGFKNEVVRAAGAIGLLVMAFFFNPAQLVFSGKICKDTPDITITGIVRINSILAKNISVACVEIGKSDNTGDLGGFVITDISTRLLNSKDSLSFIVEGFKEKKYLIGKSSDNKYNFEIYLTDKDKVSQIIEPAGGGDTTPITIIEEKNNGTEKQKAVETSINELTQSTPATFTFNLQGRVIDEDGRGIQKLTVILQNPESGEEIEVPTNSKGYFIKPLYNINKDSLDLKFNVFVSRSDGSKDLIDNYNFKHLETTNLKYK